MHNHNDNDRRLRGRALGLAPGLLLGPQASQTILRHKTLNTHLLILLSDIKHLVHT